MDTNLYAFVESAMRRAGDILLGYYRDPELAVEAKGIRDVVTEADRASEMSLIADIQARFPGHDVLGEETGWHGTASEHLWLLDPLEATYNFSRGLPMWGINLALRGAEGLRIGAFFDPLLNELYYAEKAAGAFRNGSPIRTSGLDDLSRAVVYCSVRQYVDLLDGRAGRFRHIGSIGNALAYVAAGHLDGAIEVGGGPWDYASGELLVREAGGVLSSVRRSGTPIVIASATEALHAQLTALVSR